MLFFLIPLAWLAIIVFFLVICRMAALGDASFAPVPERTHPVDELLLRRTGPSWRSRTSEQVEAAARRYATHGIH
jgi:hypothetical protein